MAHSFEGMALISHLRLFVRIVETGSVSVAARNRGITHPTASKQIANLEAHLDAQLLQRSGSGLKMTEAGAQLYHRGKVIPDEVAALEGDVSQFRGQPSGVLRVSAPVAFGQAYVVPLLLQLASDHPQIAVDLVLNDRWFNLGEQGIDVGVRFGQLPDSRPVGRQIGVSPQVCLAVPDYLKQFGEPAVLQELEQHRCILNSLVSPNCQWTFRSAEGELEVTVNVNFRTNNLQAIRSAVRAGNGIAVGPLWLYFGDIRYSKVTRILSRFKPAPLPIHAVYVHSGHQPAKVRTLLDAFTMLLKTTPAFYDLMQQPQRAAKTR